MNNCIVLVNDWQMQCCGKPFNMRDIVSWIVAKWDSERVFYVDINKIDYYYEHHSSDYTKLYRITGTVARIQALYCNIVPDPSDPTGALQIKSPGDILPVENFADGYEEDIDGQEFDAYLVYLDDAHIAPAKKSEITFC